MSRFTRIATIAASVILVLGVGLTLIVRSQIDPEKLKVTIETEAAKALGRKVVVGSVGASYGLAVGIRDLQIMDAEGKTPQVTLGFVRVAVAASPLVRGQVKLASVAIENLDVKAVRNADGTLDSADVLAKVGGGTAAAGQAGTKAPGDSVTVSVAGSRIELTDLTGVLPRKLRWSGINGTIDSGEEIHVKLAGQLEAPSAAASPGSTATPDLVLASKVSIAADYSLTSNKGQVTLSGKDIALERVRAVVPALKAAPVQASGGVDATVSVSVEANKPTFAGATAAFKDVQTTGRVALSGINGEIAYNGASVEISGLAMAAGPAHVALPKASIAVKPGGVSAENIGLLINDLPVTLSLSMLNWPAAPQMTVHVSAPTADLAKLSPQMQGALSVDVIVAGSPAQPTVTGKIALTSPARIVLPESAGSAAVTVSAGTLTLNGQDLTTSDITCQVMGFTCKPRLTVSALFAGPQVAFDSGALILDLTRLPSMLTGDMAAKVKEAAPQGSVKLSLRATGPLSAPRLSGAVEPEGVSVQVPGTGRRVSLARGKIDIAGSRATVSNLALSHEGIAVLVSGGIEGLTGTPRLSLDVQGKNLQVARLVALLPPESAKPLEPFHPGGQVDVEALVAGTAANLRTDARVQLHGLSVVATMGERKLPITLNSGAVEISPSAIMARGIDGVMEGVAFQVAGSVKDYLTEPAFDITALARGLNIERLRGFVPEEALAQVRQRQVQLSFDAKATIKGTKSAPLVAVRVLPTAGTVPVPMAGKILVATLSPGGEVSLEDKTIVLTGLPVTVLQNTVKISGTVKNFQGDATLELRIDGQGLNVGGLAPMLPDAAKRTLAQSGFRGGKGVRATVSGAVSAPAIEAVVDLAGAEFNALGPLGAGRIPHGALKMTPGGLVIEALTVEVGRAPFEVAGKVTLSDPPTIAMSVKSEALDLAALSSGLPLPAGVSLDGTTRVDVKIEGTAAEPRINGRVGLAGMGVRVPLLAQPLRGTGGELVLAGDDVVISDAAFSAGASRITAKGRVVGFARDATLDGVEVTGPVELADVAARVGMALTGRGQVVARASGTARDLKIDGTVQVASGTFTTKSGVPVPLSNISANFSRGPAQLKIGNLSGSIAGGQIGGSVVVNQTANPPTAVMNVTLDGADLAKLAPQSSETRMTGKASLAFNGNAAGGVETLSGNGQVKVTQLVVDLSNNSQLANLRATVQGGSLAAAALGSLFKRKDAGAKASAQATFYSEVLKEARQTHELGTVTSPIAADHGVIRMDPIQGPKVAGRVTVNMGNGAIQGSIDKLQLGRAAMVVSLGGTLSSPKALPDKDQLTLDGKRFAETEAAGTTADTKGTSTEADVQSSLTKKLGGKNAKALSALLGGGGEEEATDEAATTDAASPAADAAPAAPKKKKKLAAQLLDAALGGGGDEAEEPAPAASDAAPDAAAPADPAPEPAPKKKKKLFDTLLQGIK